jgi:hypothetical protein
MAQNPRHRSHAEGSWVPATIETCRIINVNIQDWTVDVMSEYGNKKYFDIQVMSPYFHFMNAEGIYVQPEPGCLVWLCRPTSGEFAAPFVMGFQAPFDEDTASFRNGRQTLNPGDIMMRTRDENFVILRRGGVVQIGATPMTQRMFIPIRNFIKDFCENYELYTLGGQLTWITERTDQTVDGAAPTKFSLLAKEKANNPLNIAELTVGSHGPSDTVTLALTIYDNGEKSRKPMISWELHKDGTSNWYVEKDWNLTTKKNIAIESQEGNVSVKATAGTVDVVANKAMSLKSETADVTVEAGGKILEKSTGHTIDAPEVKLGGAGAVSPIPMGNELKVWLESLLSSLNGAMICAAPGSPAVFAPSEVLKPLISTFLSPVSKTM